MGGSLEAENMTAAQAKCYITYVRRLEDNLNRRLRSSPTLLTAPQQLGIV